jgi:hypothetical protein
MKRLLSLLPLGLLLGGCLDFEDPTIPDRRSPAVLQASMRIFDAGIFQVDGSLSPGREESGFLRFVQMPFMQSGPYVIEPRTLSQQGVRTYQSAFQVPRNSTEGPFELILPDVRGTPPLPTVRWWGLRRVGGDTITVQRGSDIVLRIDTIPEASSPPNRFRQWFLEIQLGSSFRVSGDGAPPAVMRIPAEWVPQTGAPAGVISLVYLQSTQLRAADNSYIANVTLDTRLTWHVRFVTPP